MLGMKSYLSVHIQEFSGSKLVDVGAGLRHSTAVTGRIDNTVWLCEKCLLVTAICLNL